MEWTFILERMLPAVAVLIGLYFTVSGPIKKALQELKDEIIEIKLDMKEVSLKSISREECKDHRREIYNEMRDK